MLDKKTDSLIVSAVCFTNYDLVLESYKLQCIIKHDKGWRSLGKYERFEKYFWIIFLFYFKEQFRRSNRFPLFVLWEKTVTSNTRTSNVENGDYESFVLKEV